MDVSTVGEVREGIPLLLPSDPARPAQEFAELSDARAKALLEILKLKSNEASALQSNIIRTATIFLAVTGAVFKFAFDQNSTKTLTVTLSVFGLMVSLVFLGAAACSESYRQRLVAELTELRSALGVGEIQERLLGIRYSNMIAGLAALTLSAMWVYVMA